MSASIALLYSSSVMPSIAGWSSTTSGGASTTVFPLLPQPENDRTKQQLAVMSSKEIFLIFFPFYRSELKERESQQSNTSRCAKKRSVKKVVDD
ncbi:hypothetical protein [Stieleria varia]|uniref:hypothetical protein n=1 Tax=Stieleria varia TaxID=2528005 RepID=UPI001E536AEE|nr:hypothetical protein [Stieleria varia]